MDPWDYERDGEEVIQVPVTPRQPIKLSSDTAPFEEIIPRFGRDGNTNPDFDGLDIKVMSLAEVRAYQPESKDTEVCISIASPPYMVRYGKQRGPVVDRPDDLRDRFADVLELEFNDTMWAKKEEDLRDDDVPMTRRQAAQIVQFVKKHKSNKKRIVVHCYAGISRSRSTAAVIAKKLGLPYFFTPINALVEKYLTEAFEE